MLLSHLSQEKTLGVLNTSFFLISRNIGGAIALPAPPVPPPLNRVNGRISYGLTLEPKNTGTVALFSFTFPQIFLIFSKST